MPQATRFWLAVLGAGALSGGLYLMVTLGSTSAMLFAYFTQLPLFLIGLSAGLAASALAGAVAAGMALALHGLPIAAIFAIAFLMPVLVLLRQALLSRSGAGGELEWYPPGLMAGWLVGIGVALVAASVLFLMLTGGAEPAMRAFVGKVYDAAKDAMPRGAAPMDRAQTVDMIAGYLPGVAVASLLVMTAVNGALAQGALMRFGMNLRPAPDIAALDLPVAVAAIFAGGLALGLVLPGDLGFLARNLAPVTMVGAALAGLAVVHWAARRFEARAWMLGAIYVAAALLVWPFVLLAAVGFAEPFLKLRRRMAGV
jgi:hypothetical protein